MEKFKTTLTPVLQTEQSETVVDNVFFVRLILSNVNGTLAVILNIVNIIVLSNRVPCFGKSTTIFVRALALADLLSGCSILISENVYGFSILGDANYQSAACLLLLCCTFFSSLMSFHLLTCVTFDRFLAVKFPLRYRSFLPVKRATRMCCAVALNCLFVISAVIYERYQFAGFIFDGTIRLCVPTSYSVGNWNTTLLILFYIYVLFGGLFVPFLLMNGCNAYLFIVTLYQARRDRVLQRRFATATPAQSISACVGHNRQKVGIAEERSKEIKVIRTFMTITGIFLLTWSPIMVIVVRNRNPAVIQKKSADLNNVILVCGIVCININSWANVAIYYFMNTQYRNQVKKRFHGCRAN